MIVTIYKGSFSQSISNTHKQLCVYVCMVVNVVPVDFAELVWYIKLYGFTRVLSSS